MQMSSSVFCKILSFKPYTTQEVFNTSGSNSLGQLILLYPFNIQNCFCSPIKNHIAFANEANVVNKDFPVAKKSFCLLLRPVLLYFLFKKHPPV